MIAQGYTLVNMTPLGNLDDRRDSYEGTIVYHWKKKILNLMEAQIVDRGAKEDLK